MAALRRSANLFVNIKSSLSTPKLLMRNAPRQVATLSFDPKPAFCDDVIRLHFSGLPPSSEVKIKCSLVIAQDKIEGRSQAHFQTDTEGFLDLSSSPSSGSSYNGVNPMGLFWSMDLHACRVVDPSNVMEPLSYDITVTDMEDNTLSKSVLERNMVNPGVKRVPVNKNGVVGTMFVPPGEGPFPAVLVLTGGKGVQELCSAYLANHGFATLALAYFGIHGLPKTYNKVNIEYFEDSVDLLQRQAFIREDVGVGVFGRSKGGDISLSMASFLPKSKVRAVTVVNGGISSLGGTTSYKGVMIPAHGFREGFDFSHLPLVKGRIPRTLRSLGSFCPLESVPQCRIPFERSEADILFVAGDDDMCWESQESAEKAKSICQEFGKENVEIKTYPGMGHWFMPPFYPIATSVRHAMAPKGVFIDNGGSDKLQHTNSQIRAWTKIINFFESRLKPVII